MYVLHMYVCMFVLSFGFGDNSLTPLTPKGASTVLRL